MIDWSTFQQEVLVREYFGNILWDYLVALGVFVAAITALPIIKGGITKRLQALAKKTGNDFDDLLVDLLKRFVGPFVYLLTALYLAALSLTLAESLIGIFQGLFVVIVTFKLTQILQGVAVYGLRKWAEQTAKDDPAGAAMMKNMTIVIRLVLWVAAVLFVLDNLDINITAFVASLGVGGGRHSAGSTGRARGCLQLVCHLY